MAVKRTIRFNDMDGDPVEQDWYFTLAHSDMTDLNFVHENDVQGYLEQLVRENDTERMTNIFRQMLKVGVGKRVGNLLVKNADIQAEFMERGWYSQLFTELIMTDDGGASFFLSIMPVDVQEKAIEMEARVYTKNELLEMTDDEFFAVVKTKDLSKMSKENMLIAYQRATSDKPAA